MSTKGKTGTSSRSASTGLLDETHAIGLDSGEENVRNTWEYRCQQSGNSQRRGRFSWNPCSLQVPNGLPATRTESERISGGFPQREPRRCHRRAGRGQDLLGGHFEMKLLLDERWPWRAKYLFAEGGNECETVRDAGLSGKENGELIALAEKKFDVLITIDKYPPSTEPKRPEYRCLDYPYSFKRSR